MGGGLVTRYKIGPRSSEEPRPRTFNGLDLFFRCGS